MIAVANIWLFFYAAVRSARADPWRCWPGRAQLAGRSVHGPGLRDPGGRVEGGGFLHDLLPGRAADAEPQPQEAAAIEGASRWYFFRRVQWPLLMPTTLFVLVNAVINAFRLVDHIFILTRGGPDNASTLLLYHLYEVGFKFWDTGYAAAITVVLVVVLAGVALLQFFVLDKRCITNECRCTFSTRNRAAATIYATSWLDTMAAWMLALLWILPLAYAVWTAFHPADVSTRLDLSAPWTLQNFRHAWEAAPFARYFLNTAILVTLILAAQLVLSTLAALPLRATAFVAAMWLSRWCWCS